MLRQLKRRRAVLHTCWFAIAAAVLAACGEGSIEPVAGPRIAGGASGGSAGAAVSGSDTGSGTGTAGKSAGTGGDGTGVGAGAGGSSAGGASVGSGGSSGGSGPTGGAGGAVSAGAGGAGAAGGPPGKAGAAGAGGGAGGPGTPTGAWRPFSDTSPWNTPIPQAPAIDPDSAALVADLAASMPSGASFWINIQQYSIPVYWADTSTPLQKMSVTVLAGEGFGTGAPTSTMVPIPAGALPAAGTDRHLCIVDKQAHTEWGMWDASNGAAGWTCSVAATSDLSGTGVRPPKTGNPSWWTSAGARACGFPLIAGLITVEEMQKGKIEHALVVAYSHIRSHFYKSPASTAQGTTNMAIPTRGIPCGGRIQLDPALDVSGLALSASGKIIARALQAYGAYVGDFSGAISLYADASPGALGAWNGGLLTNGELGALDLTKLRVLSIGPLLEDTN